MITLGRKDGMWSIEVLVYAESDGNQVVRERFPTQYYLMIGIMLRFLNSIPILNSDQNANHSKPVWWKHLALELFIVATDVR